MPAGNRPYPLGTAIPTVYDTSWQSYTNLTPQQIAAFEAFPQDLIKYTALARWRYENRLFDQLQPNPPNSFITVGGVPITMTPTNLTLITGLALDATNTPANAPYSFTNNGSVYTLTAQQALGLFSGVRGYIQQCRNVEATLINGINGQTITNRNQVDTAFAALN